MEKNWDNDLAATSLMLDAGCYRYPKGGFKITIALPYLFLDDYIYVYIYRYTYKHTCAHLAYIHVYIYICIYTPGWWLETYFMFPYSADNDSN